MKKKFWTLMLVVVLILAVTVSSSAQSEKPASELKVGVIVKNLVNPYFVNVTLGGKGAAAKYGVEYNSYAPQRTGDVEGQVRIMEDLIQKGYDAICISPIDSKGIVSAIERANEAGVPVITLDTKALGGEVLAHAGISQQDLSIAIGEYLIEKFDGQARIIEVEGTPGSTSSIERKEGFKQVFEKEDGIEVLERTTGNYQKADAMRVTEDLLVRFQNVDAIVTYNDSMALGAVEALKGSGLLDEIVVTGMNGSPDALDSIERGELTVTVDSGPFETGFDAVEAVILYLTEGKVPPKVIVTGGGEPIVVDKENVEEYKERIPKLLEKYGVEQ